MNYPTRPLKKYEKKKFITTHNIKNNLSHMKTLRTLFITHTSRDVGKRSGQVALLSTFWKATRPSLMYTMSATEFLTSWVTLVGGGKKGDVMLVGSGGGGSGNDGGDDGWWGWL